MAKRDPSLISLSRDHHKVLAHAMRLKRAGGEDAEEAGRQFLDFWREHGQRHFAIEEELLLPAFARHVHSDDETIVQVLTEHVEIRRRVGDLARNATGAAELHELGMLLDKHVRLEERVLFERMQALMSPSELAELGQAAAAAG